VFCFGIHIAEGESFVEGMLLVLPIGEKHIYLPQHGYKRPAKAEKLSFVYSQAFFLLQGTIDPRWYIKVPRSRSWLLASAPTTITHSYASFFKLKSCQDEALTFFYQPCASENEVEGAHIVKRASITDVATLGYATQNGGFVILSLSPRYKSLLPGS